MNPTTPVDRNMFNGTVTHLVPGFPPISLHCVENVRIRSYSGPYSVQMRESTDENNSEYGHFLCSAASYHIEIVVEYPIKLHWI